MTKVVKLRLISNNDNIIDYKSVNKILWDIQKDTRNISNKVVQMVWENWGWESDYKKNNDMYPTKEINQETYGYNSISGLIYHVLSDEFVNDNSSNLSQTIQSVVKALTKNKISYLRGDKSIPSFRKNVPIDVSGKNIKLFCCENEKTKRNEWYTELSLISRKYKKELGLKSSLNFKILMPPKATGSTSAILERCADQIYKISSSKIIYQNGKWFLNLSYSFEKKTSNVSLDDNKVMGIHISNANAVTVAHSNSTYIDTIDGGEIEAFASQIYNRKRSIQKATKKYSDLCGGGRVGHGYTTKLKPLEHIERTISNFRNTTNHKYSRQIVNWAIKYKCGVIQIEDLTGLSTDKLNVLKMKDWSYFDLTSKIEYKAKEVGIKVEKIPYIDLQKFCPDCNELSVHNTDENMICEKCGQIYDTNDSIKYAVLLTDLHIKDKIQKAKEKLKIKENDNDDILVHD